MKMGTLKTFFIAVIVSLTFVSGSRAQEYEWHITYPLPDSGKYDYMFHAVDCYGEVCIAVGKKRLFVNDGEINTLLCFRSTDGGQTWKEQDPGLPHQYTDWIGTQTDPQLTAVQQIDSLNAVAAGDSGLIIKTTDGGNTWNRLNLNSTRQVYNVNFSDPMTGILVKGWESNPSDTSNILFTHDGGLTWLPSPFCPWLAATMCHSDGGESFRAIGDGEGPIYTTHDDWNTFDSTAWIIPLADTVHVFAACNFKGTDTLVGYGASYIGGTNPYMFIDRSSDGGNSWSMPDVPDTLIQYTGNNITSIENMSSIDRDIVFYGGWSTKSQIAVSHDNGTTWDIENYKFDKADTVPQFINALAVTQNNEGVGIFGYAASSINPNILARGVPLSSGVVTSTSVQQSLDIFPNPATNTVFITNSSGPITLTDPLGRIYTVPRNGNALDISSLPSGVYFVSDMQTRAKFVIE
jgi:photosystem II stability/assembly factor-like uncharacterized protein